MASGCGFSLSLLVYCLPLSLSLCRRLYSFGYGRVEVLSGFVNSLFLVSIATAVLSEALTRLLDPPTINTDKLLVRHSFLFFLYTC